jgi:hypothetical protein
MCNHDKITVELTLEQLSRAIIELCRAEQRYYEDSSLAWDRYCGTICGQVVDALKVGMQAHYTGKDTSQIWREVS